MLRLIKIISTLRFIPILSYSIARKLQIQQSESHQKRFVYYYGLQAIIGELTKLILLVLLSVLTRSFISTMIVFIVFALLRTVAGGYHMSTIGKCALMTLLLFVSLGNLAQNVTIIQNADFMIIFIVITFIFAMIVAIKYAPKDSPNKPITNPIEIKKFKTRTMIYLYIWGGLMGVLCVLKFFVPVLASCFGVILEMVTVTPAGYKLFEKIDV